MTCHRRYTFTFPIEVGYDHVQSYLDDACESYWWYSNPKVRGRGLNVLQVEFQVAARDQWFAYKRAVELMERAVYSLGVELEIPAPEWEPLPPHTNRGYNRVSAQ